MLEVKHLNVRFRTDTGEVAAVNDLSFDLQPGECVGIVGESGSGKTQTFLAALGLLADNGRATGSVRFHGQELLNATRSKLETVRGKRIAIIFQDALSGLTPTMRIGEQLVEGLMRHRSLARHTARDKVIELLEIVRIPEAASRFRSYPFELSGGMRQRVMIAMAMICEPEIVVADEPTTALDVTVQADILRLLDGVKRHTGTAIVMITHDLAVVAGLCDRVIIMYGGRAVEYGETTDIFKRPQHPYTQGLLQSMPTLDSDPGVELPAIPGQPPDAERLPPGCAFAPRCPHVMNHCADMLPELRAVAPGHRRACHLNVS